MEDVKIKSELSKVDITAEDAMEMFDILDVDASGSLKMEEFIEGCTRARGAAKAKDVLALTFTSRKITHQLGENANQIGNLQKSMVEMQERFDDKFDQVMNMMAKISLVSENQVAIPALPKVANEWLSEEQPEMEASPELVKVNPEVDPDTPREGSPKAAQKCEVPKTAVP